MRWSLIWSREEATGLGDRLSRRRSRLEFYQEALARREKLQQDLAARQSTFFLALQQQIYRRLHPSTVIPRTEEEVAEEGHPSLLTHLQRYGGFKGQRGSGADYVDFRSRFGLGRLRRRLCYQRSTWRLGVMALEQSAFDAGDWGLAYVLPLIEDPPQVLFQDRECSQLLQQAVPSHR